MRRCLGVLLFAGGLLAAAPLRAQFIPFTRCHGAYPCNVPYEIQYKPDPLIAGPYPAAAPASAVSAHMNLSADPNLTLDKPAPLPISDDPVEASVKAFLKKHPGPKAAPAKTARKPEPLPPAGNAAPPPQP
jgi:hypothetical protein